jgi:hypothetical protein
MTDREVIEKLVDFLCDQNLYTVFTGQMEDEGYQVVEDYDDNSNYITIEE